jgi:hypothetical protein
MISVGAVVVHIGANGTVDEDVASCWNWPSPTDGRNCDSRDKRSTRVTEELIASIVLTESTKEEQRLMMDSGFIDSWLDLKSLEECLV